MNMDRDSKQKEASADRRIAEQRLLEHPNLSPETLLDYLRLSNDSPERQLKLERLRTADRRWYDIPLTATVFTAFGALVSLMAQGWLDLTGAREQRNHEFDTQLAQQRHEFEQQQEVRGHEVALEQMRHQASVFDVMLVVDPSTLAYSDTDAAEESLAELANRERRARICLSAKFGVIRVPDELLPQMEGESSYYMRLQQLLDPLKCDDVGLPSQLPTTRTSEEIERINDPAIAFSERVERAAAREHLDWPAEASYHISDGVLLSRGSSVRYDYVPRDKRPLLQSPSHVVVSYTAGRADGFVHWLREGFGAGPHLIIERDGTVRQLHSFDEVGAHTRGWNSSSIGIWFENWGELSTRNGSYISGGREIPTSEVVEAPNPCGAHNSYWQRYTEDQQETIGEVLAAIGRYYPRLREVVRFSEASDCRAPSTGPALNFDRIQSALRGVNSDLLGPARPIDDGG